MKKIIALLLVAIMAFGLIACTGETDPAGDNGKTTFAIVPKSAGNPYNEKMAEGFKAACEAMGIECKVLYPEDVSVEAQQAVINNLVAEGIDGIALAANDATALEATLKAAKEKGVTIVTLDSDGKGSQLFVNQAGVKEVAQVLVDSVFEMAGGEGDFAILSASSTATNQNDWIAAMEEILKEDKYSKLNLVATVYGDDESQKSTTETNALLANYANLKVICCPTTVGVLACAKTVQDAKSSVKVAGLGLPSEMNGYVGDDKVCPYMYLWNPIDVGSCAAYMIKAIKDGKVGDIGTSFTADNGKTYSIVAGTNAEKQIIVGPPFAFTGENIAEWAAVY